MTGFPRPWQSGEKEEDVYNTLCAGHGSLAVSPTPCSQQPYGWSSYPHVTDETRHKEGKCKPEIRQRQAAGQVLETSSGGRQAQGDPHRHLQLK